MNGEGNHNELLHYPHVLRETISLDDSNATALQKMAKLDVDAIIAVDKEGHLKGVAERERVISRIMVKLIER